MPRSINPNICGCKRPRRRSLYRRRPRRRKRTPRLARWFVGDPARSAGASAEHQVVALRFTGGLPGNLRSSSTSTRRRLPLHRPLPLIQNFYSYPLKNYDFQVIGTATSNLLEENRMSRLPPLFSPSPSPSVTPSIDSPTSRTTPASTMPAAGPTSAASDRKQLTQPHEQTDPLLEFAQTTSAFANNGILSVQSAAAKAAQSVKAHVPDVSAQALKSGPHFLSALSDMSRSGFVTIFKIASTPLPAGDSGEEAPDASWREHSASSADRMQWQKATGAGVPDIANSSFGTYEGTTKATMHVAGKTATSPVILTGTTDGAVNRA